MTDEQPVSDVTLSKSQRKREMGELRELATRLAELNQDQIDQINDTVIRESVEATLKITKGNARKRQIQYTAKLLSKIDNTQIRQLIDTLDSSSAVYVQKFHRLENWRERLIDGDESVWNHIFLNHPDCDRQLLRQLTRNAVKELSINDKGPHFKKLFQFLKQLS